jgi:GT2 family glycosyltransferase
MVNSANNMNNNSFDVTIIIVNYNTKVLLQQCLKSIYEAQSDIVFETIVIDNASKDESTVLVREHFPQVVLIENPTNSGFSKANNTGSRIARGRYLLLLNSDTIVLPGAIDKLVKFMDDREDVAAVGPMLLNEDGTLQRSWFNFPSIFKTFCHIAGFSRLIYKLANFDSIARFFQTVGKQAFMIKEVHKPMQVDYLLLACLLIRREVYASIGLLDENLFFYHEDCELGYRAYKKHLNVYYLPDSRIIHLGGSSSSKYILKTYREYFRSLIYVFSKHEGMINTLLLRIAIIIGMLFRSFFWLFGGYRNIRKVGIYQSTTSPIQDDSNPSAKEVLFTYFKIMTDSFRKITNQTTTLR